MVTKISEIDKEAIRLQIERTLYKKSYFEFFCRAVRELEPTTDWHLGWYHEYLCNLLQREAERISRNEPKTTDYCISIPPRSSKSLLFSSVFNAWLWLYYPNQRILSLSYSDELSGQLAYQTKLIFALPFYQRLNTVFELRKDDNTKSKYSNTLNGSRYAAGFQATITGFGGEWIIVDDAAKANEVGEVKRKAVIEQYKNTIFNRLNNPKVGVRLIIGQRLHQQDLIGYLIENQSDMYTYINLPASINDNIRPIELKAEYEKRLGFLLPELFDAQTLEIYKRGLGSYGYSAQYQMSPVPPQGGIFKYDWFQIIDWQEEFKNLIWHMYIDSAYGKKASDASAVMIAARWGNNLLIKRVYQLFLEFPELIQEIKRIHTAHCNHLSKVKIEPKASGISLIQSIKKETKFNVMEYPSPKDDKVVRANAISPIAESQRIYVVDGSFNTNFLDEVCNFPFAAYDDMLDCLIMATDDLLNHQQQINYLTQKHPQHGIRNIRK